MFQHLLVRLINKYITVTLTIIFENINRCNTLFVDTIAHPIIFENTRINVECGVSIIDNSFGVLTLEPKTFKNRTDVHLVYRPALEIIIDDIFLFSKFFHRHLL